MYHLMSNPIVSSSCRPIWGPSLTIFNILGPFLHKKIPYWPAPRPQKGRGQKNIFLRTCSPVGSSICKRLQDKKAHLWRFVAIFDHFWPFFSPISPKKALHGPPKIGWGKKKLSYNLLRWWAEQKNACKKIFPKTSNIYFHVLALPPPPRTDAGQTDGRTCMMTIPLQDPKVRGVKKQTENRP